MINTSASIRRERLAMYCPDCGAEVPVGASLCPTCGRSMECRDPAPQAVGRTRSRGTAVLLSLLFPGLGEIYVGAGGRGAMIMVANLACFFLGMLLLTPFLACPVLWLFSMYDSYVLAEEHNERLVSRGDGTPPRGRSRRRSHICHSARPSIVIDRLRKRSSPWRGPLCAAN